ncbi:hypothetical protein SAMN04488527_101144 [Aliiroseovarius crassostreae]|uniref:Uncharacterized protein n=1 Tax=Aliiroseovarius crassostreae TaxID=154981 RepID=A0A0P7I4E5_9RHOB|nr:hypothetical protein [Aliiroseovarius crassostreae]KPN64162.1 hypothetical protein AKJ29_16050 [Aliiroseovarius crassostreae]SFU29216.1 hypothetical protein SAMN04488527_101144 [Aliiroseovarius crassostreae]
MAGIWAFAGAVFGAVLWIFGGLAGVQSVPVLGAFLLAPALFVGFLTGVPMIEMGRGVLAFAFLLTVSFWAFLFWGIARGFGR